MKRIHWTTDDLAACTTESLRVMKHWREVSLRSHQANLAAGDKVYPSGFSVQAIIKCEEDTIALIAGELERRNKNDRD